MVSMLPYSARFPADFSFEGPTILVKYSDDGVHDFHVSHSSDNNQTVASLRVSLDSPGLWLRYSVLLGRITVLRMQIRPIVRDVVAWSVCLSVGRSVGLSVTIVNQAKTDEPIKMPFGMWTQVGRRKHVFRWGCALAQRGEYD